MDTISVNYLITAKVEYEKKLLLHLKPNIYKLLLQIYNNSEIMCNEENNPENILMLFQYNLASISKWKPYNINNYYQKFIKEEKCNYFSDLLKIIFITHIRILTLLGHNGKELNIEIPSPGKFLHLTYLEAARNIYQVPYLFYNSKQNLQYIYDIIEKSIISIIQTTIPINEIVANCNLEQFNIKDYNKKIKEDLKNIIDNSNNKDNNITPEKNINNKSILKNNIDESIINNSKETNNIKKSKTLKSVSFASNNEVIKTNTLKRPLNLSNILDLNLDNEFNNSSIKEIFLNDSLQPQNLNELILNNPPTKKNIKNPSKPLFYDQINLPTQDNKPIAEDMATQDNKPIPTQDNKPIAEDMATQDNKRISEDMVTQDNKRISEDMATQDNKPISEDMATQYNKPIPTQDNKPIPTQDNKPIPTQDNKPIPTQDNKPISEDIPTQDNKPIPTQDNKPISTQDNKPISEDMATQDNNNECFFFLPIKDSIKKENNITAEKIANIEDNVSKTEDKLVNIEDDKIINNNIKNEKPTLINSSINLLDLIGDINEINLDNILNETEKKKVPKTILPNKFSFFKDTTTLI
jgi:hypothetical protein